MDISTLIQVSNANRVLDLENRLNGTLIKGDFEGSVTGYWKRLGSRGEGVVGYNDKEYITKSIGFVSAPAGTEVELSYAKGIYYSKF